MDVSQQEFDANGTALESIIFQTSDLSPAAIASWKTSRDIRPDKVFVLLLGPSAVGKSSLIHELIKLNPDTYYYVRPFTTRPSRPDETDKTSVTDQVFSEMEKSGAFACVNNLYGYRFGTPLTPILEAQKQGQVPILDFPLDKVAAITKPDYDLVNLYILPPSVRELHERINATNRNQSGRLESGLNELVRIWLASFSIPEIDFKIVNPSNQLTLTAKAIQNLINQIRTN